MVLLLLLAGLGMMVGCEENVVVPRPPVPPARIAYEALSKEGRVEFAKALSAVISDFDDLYGKVDVAVVETAEGADVTIVAKDSSKAPYIEKPLGILLANFVQRAPGMRFVATGDDSWKLVFPGTMQVAADGKFDFKLP